MASQAEEKLELVIEAGNVLARLVRKMMADVGAGESEAALVWDSLVAQPEEKK